MEGWNEVNPGDYTDLSYMTKDDGMYIIWMPTQQIYIESLAKTFGPEVSIAIANYVPPYVDIEMRFVTSDPSNENSTPVVDYFTMRVYSNNETLSDSCEDEFYNNLYMDPETQMSGSRTYNIGDAERKDIYVPSVLVGEDALSPECRDLVYVSLDYKLPGEDGEDNWETRWILDEEMDQKEMDQQ